MKTIHHCKQCIRDKATDWYKNNTVRHKLNSKKWVKNNPKERKLIVNKSNKITRDTKKQLVISHYSKGTNKCACCGEDEIAFLTIDHINGGGNVQRKTTGSGSSFYWWLVKNNFPKGYQVLCYNCNCGRAKTKDGICPHKH